MTKLVVSYDAPPTSLDPAQADGINERTLNNQTFDSLVYSNGKGKLTGDLATRWRKLGPKSWRFILRRHVNFTDGEPFNASSVAFSVKRDQSKLAPEASTYANIKAVKIVNRYTADFILKAPDNVFPELTVSLFMQPPKYDSAHTASYVSVHPVGTGPYEVDSWVQGSQITLSANPSYWQGVPTIKQLVFRPITDDSTRVAALETGQVDIAENVPPSLMQAVVSNGRAKIEKAEGPRAVYIGLYATGGTPLPALANPLVRQALNYAVDKSAMIKSLLLGTATAIGQPIPESGYLGYNPSVKPYPYDPAKAKMLLAKAGYPNGFSAQLDYSAQWLTSDQASAVQSELANIGVKVTLNQESYNGFSNNLFANKYAPLYSLSIQGQEGMDASEIYNTAIITGGSFNWNKYSDPAVDKLIEAGEAASTTTVRRAKFMAAEVLLHRNPPWIYLWDNDFVWGVADSVHWTPRNDDQLYVYEDVR